MRILVMLGTQVTYLDGTWKLYASEEPKSVCKFVNNTDYKPKSGTNSGHQVPAATPAECCQACTGDCVYVVEWHAVRSAMKWDKSKSVRCFHKIYFVRFDIMVPV